MLPLNCDSTSIMTSSQSSISTARPCRTSVRYQAIYAFCDRLRTFNERVPSAIPGFVLRFLITDPSKEVGTHVKLADLVTNYDAVLLAHGPWIPVLYCNRKARNFRFSVKWKAANIESCQMMRWLRSCGYCDIENQWKLNVSISRFVTCACEMLVRLQSSTDLISFQWTAMGILPGCRWKFQKSANFTRLRNPLRNDTAAVWSFVGW